MAVTALISSIARLRPGREPRSGTEGDEGLGIVRAALLVEAGHPALRAELRRVPKVRVLLAGMHGGQHQRGSAGDADALQLDVLIRLDKEQRGDRFEPHRFVGHRFREMQTVQFRGGVRQPGGVDMGIGLRLQLLLHLGEIGQKNEPSKRGCWPSYLHPPAAW